METGHVYLHTLRYGSFFMILGALRKHKNILGVHVLLSDKQEAS